MMPTGRPRPFSVRSPSQTKVTISVRKNKIRNMRNKKVVNVGIIVACAHKLVIHNTNKDSKIVYSSGRSALLMLV